VSCDQPKEKEKGTDTRGNTVFRQGIGKGDMFEAATNLKPNKFRSAKKYTDIIMNPTVGRVRRCLCRCGLSLESNVQRFHGSIQSVMRHLLYVEHTTSYSMILLKIANQSYSFIQMAFMTLGSMMEADRRLLAFEQRVRHQRRIARDTEVWRRFEEDFEERGTPGVGGEGRVRRVDAQQ
jgi:hypothetical protein